MELIIKYLKVGLTQKEISEELVKKGIKPNSVSYIEKEIRKIKKQYNAKTIFHLGYILGKNE